MYLVILCCFCRFEDVGELKAHLLTRVDPRASRFKSVGRGGANAGVQAADDRNFILELHGIFVDCGSVGVL
jgi:hypothetical protein